MPTGLRAGDAARNAARELRKAGVPEPEASAEVLLSELLGVGRGEIPLHQAPPIPRPDTESVVDAALERLDARGGEGVVLDVGTGSGAIAISIAQERPRATVHATDLSERALEAAERNAAESGASVRFHRADLFAGLQIPENTVDLLIS